MIRLEEFHQQSVALYLRLQELEVARQDISLQIQQIQIQLIKLDGKIELATEYGKDEQGKVDG